jgi:hypothetical protein
MSIERVTSSKESVQLTLLFLLATASTCDPEREELIQLIIVVKSG